MRVLLVEDDRALSVGIQHALEREGWQVDALADGEQALGIGLLGQQDMAVLDLGLPRMSGMDVLPGLPVLLLTARDPLADRVADRNYCALKGLPCSRKPALMPRLANQLRFISSA